MQNIHILRHFKVKDDTKIKLNSFEFNQWVSLYDTFPLDYVDIEIPKVNKVYVSSQKRAIESANYLKLDFNKSDLLREVEAKSFINTNLKFPKNFWLFIDRFLWFFNLKKSGENRKDTYKRVYKFVDIIKYEENILIVSHGLFLKILTKELEKLGYKGNKDWGIKNAKIYHFRKDNIYEKSKNY
ncbi:MAG: histidine phosphatase family protein [Arcobacter sp.]|nr:MAG: histidine phosphatase family protein [Arcobacter sp.]